RAALEHGRLIQPEVALGGLVVRAAVERTAALERADLHHVAAALGALDPRRHRAGVIAVGPPGAAEELAARALARHADEQVLAALGALAALEHARRRRRVLVHDVLALGVARARVEVRPRAPSAQHRPAALVADLVRGLRARPALARFLGL